MCTRKTGKSIVNYSIHHYLFMQEERNGSSNQQAAGGAGVGVEEKKTPRGS